MADYTVAPARYSKGNFIVRCPAEHGLKSRAARLIGDGLNCRFTNREKGYVASVSKLRRFEKLYAEGWDASFVTGELEPPTLTTAAAQPTPSPPAAEPDPT